MESIHIRITAPFRFSVTFCCRSLFNLVFKIWINLHLNMKLKHSKMINWEDCIYLVEPRQYRLCIFSLFLCPFQPWKSRLDKSELNICSYFKIDSQSIRVKVKFDFLEITFFGPLIKSEPFGILSKIVPASVVLNCVVGDTRTYSFRHWLKWKVNFIFSTFLPIGSMQKLWFSLLEENILNE